MRTILARAARLFTVGIALLAPFSVAPLAAQQNADMLGTLDALRANGDSTIIPPSDKFVAGNRTIADHSRAAGPVAAFDGTVYVRGIVDGNVVTYHGDIVVEPGGEIRGSAYAIRGKVRMLGGVVTGDIRAVDGDVGPGGSAVPARVGGAAILHELALAGSWLAVLIIIGICVLVFASSNLDAVADAIERDFVRVFIAGIAGQLALLPALAVLVLALILTVLGVLLVPFAIVAYVLAAAGLVTLGYLAIARVTGRSMARRTGDTDGAQRAASLKALTVGLVLLMTPWLLASLLAGSPTGGLIVRTAAFAITWVAATTGLGAAIVSRGGVKRTPAPDAQRAMTSASWQTPTPVAGVVAARRPTPLSTPAPK